MQLRWLGTAGFHLRYRGHELLLDPFLSRLPGASPVIRARVEDFAHVSLILLSHGHFDHAQDAAALARVSGAEVYGPEVTCRVLEAQGLPRARLHANERHAEVAFAGARIRIVPSRHIRFDASLIARTTALVLRGGVGPELLRRAEAYPEGSSSELLLDFDGYRILFSGSGGGDYRALAKLAPDCFLLPFAGRTDVVDYYLRALKLLRPRTVVLHHFDDFFPSFVVDYPVQAFCTRAARELPEMQLVVPEPEEWFGLP
ncbi:MAG: MBL fold metallo-hydrolase [Deltaproteobacteria bacterium]|nr:MBL fold metallo-hydrolase [Deltaproteobacteria bacterium]